MHSPLTRACLRGLRLHTLWILPALTISTHAARQEQRLCRTESFQTSANTRKCASTLRARELRL